MFRQWKHGNFKWNILFLLWIKYASYILTTNMKICILIPVYSDRIRSVNDRETLGAVMDGWISVVDSVDSGNVTCDFRGRRTAPGSGSGENWISMSRWCRCKNVSRRSDRWAARAGRAGGRAVGSCARRGVPGSVPARPRTPHARRGAENCWPSRRVQWELYG